MDHERLDALLRERRSAEALYHLEQFRLPKHSTLHVAKFLETHQLPEPGATVLDAGCGCGAVLHYMANHFPGRTWIGLDIKEDNIRIAAQLAGTCATFVQGDFTHPGVLPRVDGVLCLQTLSWLQDPWPALRNLLGCNAGWVVLTSLFYDGPVEADIRIRQHHENGSVSSHCYNVYSLPILRGFVQQHGYDLNAVVPFEIEEDLPPPPQGRMGTYTRRTAEGKRLQFSGPLLLPWHTILLRRRPPCNA